MRGLEQIPFLYDAMMSLAEATGLKRWRAWIASGARGRTLDLGCGTGRNLPLLPQGTFCVGIDVSLDALKKARRRSPRTPLLLASAEALPFRDKSFDTILSGLVFCSIPKPDLALREARRVLASGGSMRMLEHVRSKSRFGARVQDGIQPVWTALMGGCYNNRDTEAKLQAAGFVIQDKGRRESGTMRRFEARPE